MLEELPRQSGSMHRACWVVARHGCAIGPPRCSLGHCITCGEGLDWVQGFGHLPGLSPCCGAARSREHCPVGCPWALPCLLRYPIRRCPGLTLEDVIVPFNTTDSLWAACLRQAPYQSPALPCLPFCWFWVCQAW